MSLRTVGMLSSYPRLEQSDWLWQQTPEPMGVWGGVQMVSQHPSPDFLLLYNFHHFPVLPPRKLVSLSYWRSQRSYPQQMANLQARLRGVPPERTIFLWREPPLAEELDKTLAIYDRAKPYCNYISGPDDYAPCPGYMPAIWYHSNAFRELADLPAPIKLKNCSWILSGVNRSANHQHRLNFLRQLRQSDLDCDIYGLNLPDYAKAKGYLQNKWHGMAHYYYNLAIENYTDNRWYVSEKLWDALLAWCLPIYFGGSGADQLIPPESFLRLPSLDAKGIDYIKEVTASPEIWQQRLPAIAQARQIILHKLNLLAWLDGFVKNL